MGKPAPQQAPATSATVITGFRVLLALYFRQHNPCKRAVAPRRVSASAPRLRSGRTCSASTQFIASSAAVMADLPKLPVPLAELGRYISQNPETPMVDIIEPYRQYEATLRTVYAQDRQNPILKDPYLNVLPLFTEDTELMTTRARNLDAESDEEKGRYVMALPDDKRRPHGSPATVVNFDEFQKNFNVFSESSLVDVNWDNVVAAGSSVVNCVLPVPKEFNTTKRKLREYYHEKFCPASDVDLFLYGLTHEEAIEKILQIEQAIRDALLNEVTVVRTKYAITIASQYPVRHIQIVLRVYKSVSEILTGFDIDAAGGAYDGKQVYVTPRALGSFITQINHVDLTRRSPSYENRLSKYSHRNFEVYWPELERSRIDPTIFERSFQRTLGLARLLVLERLPTTSARETYLNKRREERGRPTVFKHNQILFGNIKDYHEDEISDWLSDLDISNYHTFTVPYGQKFDAKRIEKLCYTRDLLLNAEWNLPDERKDISLHRHPAFFGRVEDVIKDCCGSCPTPTTPEEIEVAEKEAQIYISGEVTFLIDDPGRQQIGSFNPLTEQDWTDMAYIGDTARLCQSIVDGDEDDVLNWLGQEGADPNQRDYTGRTPLHLAVMTSTPEVVKCLVDHGARLTARLADGKTALHLAASRGDVEIIKHLMEKSIENEEAEEERQDRQRKAIKAAKVHEASDGKNDDLNSDESEDSGEDSDGELVDDETTDADTLSMTTGSFVKVKKGDNEDDEPVPDDSDDEPDYYHIDVLAWDVPCSPLHLAIADGHEGAVKLLCDYGADSILPVKFFNSQNSDISAILTLTLALSLPLDKAKSMAQLLLKLGATSSQAETTGCTAFQRYVDHGELELIDALWDNDKTGVKTAINHMVFTNGHWNPRAIAPIHNAVQLGDPILVLKLLNNGAKSQIDYETWLKAAQASPTQADHLGTLEQNQKKYKSSLEQPLIVAIRYGNTEAAVKLLENGADPNALTLNTENLMTNMYMRRQYKGESALDTVTDLIEKLKAYSGEEVSITKPLPLPETDEYLGQFQPGTYTHWLVSKEALRLKESHVQQMATYEKQLKRVAELKGVPEKIQAIQEAIEGLETLKNLISSLGGKTFVELHPDIHTEAQRHYNHQIRAETSTKPFEYIMSFLNDSEMTETRRDGYIELMEAAWTGDIERIKSLSTQAWGPQKDQPPLKMAINDSARNSPFSLAFLRGHYDTARTILEIVKAQWSPPDKDKVRFKMENRDEEYDSEDDGSDNSEGSEPRIVSEKVDRKFTIDNIGQVSMLVKSNTKPLSVICDNVPTITVEGGKVTSERGQRSLFVHVFETDDATGLKFLLDMAQHYASHKFEGDDDDESSSTAFNLSQQAFRWAVEHGKTRLVALIIKRTGAGIPLDDLVKKSGVAMKKKPRYYQGLTVYGKKRNDWATAGRNMVVKTTGSKTPPLLYAALGGNVQSVEFFLGDAPHRHYSEFGKSKASRDDPRLKHLKESSGGFDRAISKWLGADNDLVIHCAVLADVTDESKELLEYLIDACPGALEKKNSQGDSPLLVACRLGRTDYVKILIDGNADQSTRNSKGENIIHAALEKSPQAHQLRVLLDLLDADLRSHLFLHRRNLQENGTTPLHTWVSQACGGQTYHNYGFNRGYSRGGYFGHNPKPYDREKEAVAALKLLLEYSKGDELEMLNGAGETCLHTAVMHNMVSLVHVLVNFRPRLLCRENAVGRTPAEVAHDRVTGEKFGKPSNLLAKTAHGLEELLTRKPEDFATEAHLRNKSSDEMSKLLGRFGLSGYYKKETISNILTTLGIQYSYRGPALSDDAKKYIIWDICSTAMEKHPEKRRLVSLNEANDVARRLGEKYSASRYFNTHTRVENENDDENQEDEEEDKTKMDFATQQLNARLGQAWKINIKTDDGDDEIEELTGSYCTGCQRYHN
ncbi:hypothetical protein G7046_g1351 [Stylonectria norvegica]|nr:hypothetical protein G7046_g1351 [Stylonectria norvegica]